MNYDLLIPLLLTTIVAVIGWIVAHRLTASRERAGKRRELIVTYLIEAYRRLEKASERHNEKVDMDAELESAFADIQLFGTVRQLEMTKGIIADFENEEVSNISDLIEDLRGTLREELQLEKAPSPIRQLRIRS